MRINIYWRGVDLLDIEAHVFRMRAAANEDQGPALQAAPHLAASEIALPTDPELSASTPFGF